MAELAGYVGAFYITSDAGTAVTSEALTGTINGTNTAFTFTYENVDYNDLSVWSTGSDYYLNKDYVLNPQGRIVFAIAPNNADMIADYSYYPNMIQAGGFLSWSVDTANEMLETTNFDTNGWKTFSSGLKTWTGSAERHWLNDMIGSNAGREVIVRFYTNEAGSDYYTGWGIVNGIGEATSVDALVDDSLSFQGTHNLSKSV